MELQLGNLGSGNMKKFFFIKEIWTVDPNQNVDGTFKEDKTTSQKISPAREGKVVFTAHSAFPPCRQSIQLNLRRHQPLELQHHSDDSETTKIQTIFYHQQQLGNHNNLKDNHEMNRWNKPTRLVMEAYNWQPIMITR